MSENLQKALNRIEKERTEKTRTLNLSGLKLTAIPKEIQELTWLTELELRNTQLSDLPESITKLTNLTRLDLLLFNKTKGNRRFKFGYSYKSSNYRKSDS